MDFFKKNKKIFSTFLIMVFIVGGFFVFSENASAQTTSYSIEDYGASTGLTTVDLKTLAINVIKWVLGVISLVAVSLLIYGGVLWMTSRGNEEKIAKAKKVIINTLIGMVIIILAWAIVLMVGRFITGSSGDDTCCTPGDISSNQCFVCGSTCNWLFRSIPPAPASCAGINNLINFHVNDVATSHDDSDYVYMCSRVQPIFNNNVESTTVEDSVTSGRLYIENTNTGDIKAGTWTTVGNTITFKHPKLCSNDNTQNCTDDSECGGDSDTCDLMVFDADTAYEMYLPDTIEDMDGLELNALFSSVLGTAVSCGVNNGDLLCNFTTNDDIDTVMPYITSTYPVDDTSSSYPDQNVDRVPTIEVNFSESIDATTVFDLANPTQPNNSNIILEQLDGPGGGAVLEVDPAILDISVRENGFYFTPLDNLESFTWYRVTVQNIEDLCGNPMDGSHDWEFQTNDKVAGFASWYPTGSNICPDTDVIVTFNTSMYRNDVTVSVGDGSGFEATFFLPAVETSGVTSVLSSSGASGTLRITDVGDPISTHYKVFELDLDNDLASNTTYLVDVNTNKVIDSEGGELEAFPLWSFDVTTPEDCTCSPYISNLNPDRGGRGECITVNGRCFTGTSDKEATPDDVWFVSATGVDISGGVNSYGDNYMVTTFPNSPADFSVGDFVPVKTSITYDDSNYGTLASNENVTFYYNTDEEATGPCLFSVNPDYGYPGTGVSLTGIRFSGANADSRVTFSNGGLEAPVFSWSDTAISSQLPGTAVDDDDGNVNVHNNAGTSNGIPFDVQMPPLGVPIVIDRWQTCDTACVNTAIGAQFNIEMNQASLSTDNIFVYPCLDATCSSLDLAIAISTSYDDSSRIIVNITPDNLLDVDASYRVILSDNITSSEGGELGNLNYDSDADGTNDSYSWVFKTKDDPELCALASVNVVPDNHIAFVDDNINYFVYATGSPDDCDPSGQLLNPSFYDWIWSSSNVGNAPVTSNDSDTDGNVDPNQRVTARNITPSVDICAMAEGVQDCGNLEIQEAPEDPTYCVTDEDCAVNELNEPCPGSVCLDNRCTPVINWFNPTGGAAGTWVTVAGCWFGNYIEDGDKSQVLFDADKPGELLPDYCGPNTWLNYRILREVPDDVTPGSQEEIIVKGGDSGDYDYLIYSSDQFTVNNDSEIPGICLLVPDSGLAGINDVQIRGKNFGDSNEGNDWVLYHDGMEVTNYDAGPWTDTNVWTTVPVGAETGDVRLVNNDIVSNPWPFRVLDSSCTTVCLEDSECPADQGCGYDNCCYDRPQIVETTPPDLEVDVCLNTLIEVVFNEDMDLSTLIEENIQIMGPDINYTIAYPNRRTLRLYPDALLAGGMSYSITLSQYNVKSRRGVSIGTGGNSFSFQAADTDAACELSRLEIDPSYHMFTDIATPSYNFTADASDNEGRDIIPIANVYDWTWTWSSLDNTIVNVINSSNDIQEAIAQKNGRTRIKVVAEALTGWEGSREAYAETEVVFCDMPWDYEDSADCDVLPLPSECRDYNFHLFYCQGNYGVCEGTTNVCTNDYQASCPDGETCCPDIDQACEFSPAILPNLNLQVVRGQSGDVLKQYLFKESGRCTEGTIWCEGDGDCSSGTCEVTSDGIGIRIYANPSNLSPSDWYESNIENAGSPQTITVDGYQAVRDGRTIYVGATNYVPAFDGNPATLFTNIYLISYNDGADSDTIKVFNRLVENWRFNTNSIPTEKEFIARDLIRLSDLAKITNELNDYRLSKTDSESANLLQNPGFESGTGIPPDNWIAGPSPSDNFNLDSSEKHEGDQSVHIIGGSNTLRWLVQNIPVTMGKVYEVTAWLKANTAENVPVRPLTQCMFLDGTTFDWDFESCQLNGDRVNRSVSGNSGWVKTTEYVYANRADRLLRVGCALGIDGQTSNISDEGWCDGFSVREITPYPALESGSYLVNMSTSKWPSWQATLGNALGKSLPVDPLNILINCPEDFTEQGACWDETEKKFFCDPDSYIYAYQTNHGLDYTLYTNLETNTTYWDDNISNSDICSDPSECTCFDYSVSSP